jgi:hypothetical protein
MIIPGSFQAAYAAERAVIAEVREIAGSNLRTLCADHQWLFADRLKDEESVLARLQLGDCESIGDLPDFYGATVIVPTKNQLNDATDSVIALFDNAEVKKERNFDPRAFPYDDVHVRAQLGRSAIRPGDNPVQARHFEIQVRTGLQYSWWWATHDSIYKGGVQEWRAHRLASQVRASLELLDDVLANLGPTSRLQANRPSDREEDYRALSELLTHWSESQRPIDVRRFCETVLVYADKSEISVGDLVATVEEESNADVVGIPGITPAQGVFIAVYRVVGDPLVAALIAAGRRVICSPEMCEACPGLLTLEPNACVLLTGK